MGSDETWTNSGDRRTARFASGQRIEEFRAVGGAVSERLAILDGAPSNEVLLRLPGNRFEALGGNRAGQDSIRINDRWRICVGWPEGEPTSFNIEIVDHH